MGNSGECYPCSITHNIDTSATECARCKNREMQGSDCVLKDDGSCNGFWDSNHECRGCSDNGSPHTTSTECAKCENREYYDGSCYPNKCNGFRDEVGTCHSCSTNESIRAYTTECVKCENRKVVEIVDEEAEYTFTYCAPKECDDFADITGACHNCSDEGDYESASTECAKCENREYHINVCYHNKCNGLRDGNGNCYDCLDSEGILASADDCARCKDANGNPLREMIGGRCALTTNACNASFPVGRKGFRDSDGNCFDCLVSAELTANSTECAKCQDDNGDPIREMLGSLCVLKEAT